jgi:hypothetical protein
MTAKIKLKCKGCGIVAEVSANSKITDQEIEGDFAWIMLADGGEAWICRKTCFAAVMSAFKQIESVFGEETKNVSLYQLSVMSEE